MTDKISNNWSISDIWNDLLTEERQVGPREYIRASEIGKPYLDRFLAMKGKAFTNPFQARILRVFDTGKIFETLVVERIFRLLGIMIESQGELTVQPEGCLPVIGHHDPKVGGKINVDRVNMLLDEAFYRKMREEVVVLHPLYAEFLDMAHIDDWLRDRVKKLVQRLLQEYPNGMRILTTEIKTVHSGAFWSPYNQDPNTRFFKGYDHHRLQLWTYLFAGNQPEGRLFYISKDDITIMEDSVFLDDEKLKEKWFKDVREMTRIWNEGKEPAPEPFIAYNKERDVWEPNWLIKRSNYFTYITGYQDVASWEKSLVGELREKNSGLCKKCNKTFTMTTLNKKGGYCARCFKVINAKETEGGEKE